MSDVFRVDVHAGTGEYVIAPTPIDAGRLALVMQPCCRTIAWARRWDEKADLLSGMHFMLPVRNALERPSSTTGGDQQVATSICAAW